MTRLQQWTYIVLVPLAISLFYSNCSDVEFQNANGNLLKSDVAVDLDENEDNVKDDDGKKVVEIDEEVICGGILFQGEDCEEDKDKGNGLLGGLYYYPNVYSNNAITHDVNVLIEREFTYAAPIYFNKVFVPTLQFSIGFPYKDGFFEKPTGEKLVEGFAIELFTNFQLRNDQHPGEYEFALLSDDGSTLLNLDDNQLLVNNNGAHSTKLACGSSLNLSKDQKIKMRLRYYQGPRTEIALTVLMRKAAPGQSNVHCGASSQYQFFYPTFAAKEQGSAPNYEDFWFGDLLEAGWEVPTSENFKVLN